MDCLQFLRKQMTGLQSGDGPKHTFATPPRMQTSSNNSKIPRFVNHGFALPKQQVLLSSKMSVPTKRRFDDVPRLDIPLSPDTGDEINTTTTTESTTTSTVLSPSQSGDGSLVTVESWKSSNWTTSGGNCLCRKSKSTPFSPQELKEGVGNCSKIIVVDVSQSQGIEKCTKEKIDSIVIKKALNENMMEIDPDVDEVTVRLDFKMNGRTNPTTFPNEREDKCCKEDDVVDETEGEEINVSLKPICLKASESDGNDECLSLKGTESFTFVSELSNQNHSPTSLEKVSWPIFNNPGPCSNPETTKLLVKYQRRDLHARIKSMIDFGKSLLTTRNSERERSSCTTLYSTFSSRGKCESESQLSTLKSNKKDEKNGKIWNQNKNPEQWSTIQEKINSKLTTPHLCLLNSAKFNSPSSSEDWYDTTEDTNHEKNLVNNEEDVEVSPTPITSDSLMTSTDSDSAIMLSTVGVQVDLIAWDRMGKEPAEVRDIGVQVSKRALKKEGSDVQQGYGGFPAVRKHVKKRTVYFDLTTPKTATGTKSDTPNIYFDVKESESERDSEMDQSDLQTLSIGDSQEIVKSPYTLSTAKETASKASIVVKEEESISSKRLSIPESSKEGTNKSTEDENAPSKSQSEDTYIIDFSSQWTSTSKTALAIPVAVSSLNTDNKARWLKDIKGKFSSQNVIPLSTPTKIPSSTKLVRDSAKKPSASLTHVNSKHNTKKFQSSQPGERIKSMDEMRKLNDIKGIHRYKGISDTQSKRL